MAEGGARDRRLLRWLFVGALLVLGGLYVAGFAFADDRLPRSTTVAGVEVGGLRPDRARQVLAEELAPRLDDPLRIVVEDQSFRLRPEEVGLDVDMRASVAQVPVGRSWSLSHIWETLVGGEEYDAVVTDGDMLRSRLERIARVAGQPVVEGAVEFGRAGPRATYPQAGTTVDVAEATETVRAAYPSDGSTVELRPVPVEPTVSSAEVSRAMRDFANPAMSAPVTYRFGGEPVVLRPEAYARALSMEPDEDGRLVPRVDGDRLMAAFRPAMRTLAERPMNATVRIIDGRPRVVPGKKGVTIDRDRVESTFLDLVAAEEGERELRVPTRTVDPQVTTEEVRALGITEKVSEFTTYYPHADYRNVNIGRAAELINGTILEPGETFSLNGVVGERTAENGFTRGFIISNGVFKEELGGGVSQVATTTFNAAFFAGLEDVEHKPHSFYIDRYPAGREATVAWPTVDLRFRNDTEHGVLIQTLHQPSSYTSQGAITVRMWSTKVWDIESLSSARYAYTPPETRTLSGDDCVPNTGYSGFQIDVTRVFRRAGQPEVVRRERMHTTYIPADTVVCR